MTRLQRIVELLAADPYARALAVRLVEVTDRGLILEATVGEEHLNFLGVTHGGFLFSVADCAFSLASNVAGPRAVAIDTHLVLTAPAGPGEVLRVEAEEVTRGRTLATYRVTVRRGDGRVVGLFTGTVHLTD